MTPCYPGRATKTKKRKMKILTKYKLGDNERAGGSMKHWTERTNDRPNQMNDNCLRVAVEEQRKEQTNKWTNEGTNEQMNEQMNERTNKWRNERSNERSRTDGQMNKRKKLANEKTSKRANDWKNKQNTSGQGAVSRKPRKLFGPVKPLQNLEPC